MDERFNIHTQNSSLIPDPYTPQTRALIPWPQREAVLVAEPGRCVVISPLRKHEPSES